jgi:hypothetical protein
MANIEAAVMCGGLRARWIFHSQSQATDREAQTRIRRILGTEVGFNGG